MGTILVNSYTEAFEAAKNPEEERQIVESAIVEYGKDFMEFLAAECDYRDIFFVYFALERMLHMIRTVAIEEDLKKDPRAKKLYDRIVKVNERAFGGQEEFAKFVMAAAADYDRQHQA